MAQVVTFPYEQRSAFAPLHHRTQRWGVVVAHRRAGKTVATVNDLIGSASFTPKTQAKFSYIAPYYSQAKAIAWDYLKYFSQPIQSSRPSESELSVELRGNSKIRLYGADNPDALRGTYNDGVILDEYGDMKPSLWSQVILPTLADRKGWALFIGTPKGKNHFWNIREIARQSPDWFYLELKASQTGLLDDMELAEQRRLMDEDEYAQEYECSFEAALKGAVWGKEIRVADEEGRISRNYTENLEQSVDVVLDLGYQDDTAMWFWQTVKEGYILTRAYANNFLPIDDYIELLHGVPNLRDVWLPHDARAKSLQTGKSIVEQFLSAGIRPKLVPDLALRDGISAARKVLPYCHFSLPESQDGVEALRQYQRHWDQDLKVFGDKPVHNWASHYADAFRYFALIVRPYVLTSEPKKPKLAAGEPNMSSYTLDQLHSDREAKLHRMRGRI